MAQYQLVLQMPAASIKDYDEMITIEEAIIDGLGQLGEVDGHDAGSSEMNIFVLTENPEGAFEKIKSLLSPQLLPQVRVAYRRIEGDDFTILHPAGITHFEVA